MDDAIEKNVQIYIMGPEGRTTNQPSTSPFTDPDVLSAKFFSTAHG